MSGLVTIQGPKFLVKLQVELNKSLTELDKNKKLSRFARSAKEFDIYRDVFAKLCSTSQTFGPILTSIQEVYEFNIREQKRELNYKEKERQKAIQELSNLQQSIQEQVDITEKEDKKLLEISKGSSALDQLRHRTRLAHTQTRLERLEKEKRQVQVQLVQSERREMEALEQLKAEQEAKDLMFHEYAELQKQFDQYKDSQKGREDPEILRMALDQSRRDLSVAHAKINEYKYDYDSVVPQHKYDCLEREFTLVTRDNDKLTSELSCIRQEREEMVQMIREITEELEVKRLAEEEGKRAFAVKEGIKKWQKELGSMEQDNNVKED